MKILCFADTHRCVEGFEIPKVDIVICAGDFCNTGALEDAVVFNHWFSRLPCKHKILIAGNHDVCFEKEPSLAKALLNNDIVYLQDEELVIRGIKFYGTPWQLPFMNWAFNLPEEEFRKKFSKIPDDVDILITHSPPYGILDSTPTRTNLGSHSLLKKVYQVKPEYHIFGHIHHGYGKYVDEKQSITFLNVSLLDESYQFVNTPVIFEI